MYLRNERQDPNERKEKKRMKKRKQKVFQKDLTISLGVQDATNLKKLHHIFSLAR
jgi:hypothetical protein